MWVSSQSGLDGLPDLNDMDAQPENGPAGERAWESVEIHDLEGLVDSVHREHWGWKKLWEQVQELSREAVGAEIGLVHGQWLQYLEGQVTSLEEELALVGTSTLDQETTSCRIAALSKDMDATADDPILPDRSSSRCSTNLHRISGRGQEGYQSMEGAFAG